MILCDFSCSFPSTTHPPHIKVHWDLIFVFYLSHRSVWALLVSKNCDNAKNKEQYGMLVAPVLYCSKSYFLFRFNSVTAFSLRTLRVRAFCAQEWRLMEDKSSTVGPRMLLFGCEPWRKTSMKCLTASETKPSLPFIQQCSKIFGRPNMPGDEFILRVYEVQAGEMQSWAAGICPTQIYSCPQVCDLGDYLKV